MISCFANSPSDSRLLSEAQATAYDEEDAKVGMKLLLIAPGGAGTAVMLLARVDWGFCCQNIREEPIHILNVALCSADHMEDEKLVPIFRAFAQSKVCRWGWTLFL